MGKVKISDRDSSKLVEDFRNCKDMPQWLKRSGIFIVENLGLFPEKEAETPFVVEFIYPH